MTGRVAFRGVFTSRPAIRIRWLRSSLPLAPRVGAGCHVQCHAAFLLCLLPGVQSNAASGPFGVDVGEMRVQLRVCFARGHSVLQQDPSKGPSSLCRVASAPSSKVAWPQTRECISGLPFPSHRCFSFFFRRTLCRCHTVLLAHSSFAGSLKSRSVSPPGPFLLKTVLALEVPRDSL